MTGGAGYIGGHLVDYLLKGSAKVTVIDDFSTGDYKNPGARILKADLSVGYPKDLSGETIFHFAANPDVRTSMGTEVRKHYESDVTATLNALEMARTIGSKCIVFASSSVVYGNAKQIPTPEDAPKVPISRYGLFKLMGEEMVEYYSRTYGIKASILRFANVVGGRTSHGLIKNLSEKYKRVGRGNHKTVGGNKRAQSLGSTDTRADGPRPYG